jgi:hypothetical protein
MKEHNQSITQNAVRNSAKGAEMAEALIKVDGLLTVHCARNTATVHFDETQVPLEKIQHTVRECGYVCQSETISQQYNQA